MATKQENPVTALVSGSKGALEKALAGSPVSIDKFVVGLMAACDQPPAYPGAATVMQCVQENPRSVTQRLIEAAQLGLSPAPVKQHFYLIPRRIKDKLTCTSIIGYKGLIDLAMRSGQIVDIQADVVYKDDEFVIDPTTGAVENKAADPFREFDYKKLKGAFAWAQITGRSKIVSRCLSIGEIDKRRACAQTDNVWKQWPKEQVLKTAIRALLTGGFVPLGEMVEQLVDTERQQEEEIRVVEAQEVPPPETEDGDQEVSGSITTFDALNDDIAAAKTRKALDSIYDRMTASYETNALSLEQCGFLQTALQDRRKELRK